MMKDDNIDILKEDLIRVKELHSGLLQRLNSKIMLLIEKVKEYKSDNSSLKEDIRELNTRVNELKLQLTKSNTDSVKKEEEISNLRNTLLNSNNQNSSPGEKENVKSRIKELISRIDVHLDQYDDGSKEY